VTSVTVCRLKTKIILSKKESNAMQTTKAVVAKTAVADEREPLTMQKRVGSTTYVVTVRFRAKSVEILEDKLLRLIEREVTANVN